MGNVAHMGRRRLEFYEYEKRFDELVSEHTILLKYPQNIETLTEYCLFDLKYLSEALNVKKNKRFQLKCGVLKSGIHKSAVQQKRLFG